MRCPHLPQEWRAQTYHLYLPGEPVWTHRDSCCSECKVKLANAGQVDWAGTWASELTRDVVLVLEGFK